MLIQDILPPEQLLVIREVYFQNPTSKKTTKAKHHIKVR
jgi:hypothetical protein